MGWGQLLCMGSGEVPSPTLPLRWPGLTGVRRSVGRVAIEPPRPPQPVHPLPPEGVGEGTSPLHRMQEEKLYLP